MTRIDVTCVLCGLTWSAGTPNPPCWHSPDDWETYRIANGLPVQSADNYWSHWNPPPTGPTAEIAAKTDAAVPLPTPPVGPTHYARLVESEKQQEKPQ
jgi:hypothetical protein